MMAPSAERWDRMTLDERRRLVDSLPVDLGILPAEGTVRTNTIRSLRNMLDDHLAGDGPALFVANDLAVYYPAEPPFTPDIMAVAGACSRDRMHWLVSAEERGVDMILEIVVSPERRSKVDGNKERYARLGIREYFVFDHSLSHLWGGRLGEGRRYEPVSPRAERLYSEVLGLAMQLIDGRLRLYAGSTPLLEAYERVAELEARLEQLRGKE